MSLSVRIVKARAFNVAFGQEWPPVIGHFDAAQRDVLHIRHGNGAVARSLDMGQRESVYRSRRGNGLGAHKTGHIIHADMVESYVAELGPLIRISQNRVSRLDALVQKFNAQKSGRILNG